MTDPSERDQQDAASSPAYTTDCSDEEILASLGLTRDAIARFLKQNDLKETPDLLDNLLHRMVQAARQAITDELHESAQRASSPGGLTERQAQKLRNRVAQEIAASETLRHYFGLCCSIEVEPFGKHIYGVHGYFLLYGKHYGELFLRDDVSWDECVAEIHQEAKEERL